MGMIAAFFLPDIARFMRPFLPALICLVLGLAIARLNLADVFADFKHREQAVKIIGLIAVSMPVTAVLLGGVWRILGLSDQGLLLLIVFSASPPLSSAASLSLLMGFNARLTLQVAVLSTLLTPIIGPACFAIFGIDIDIDLLVMSRDIALITAGGFAIGIGIQLLFGRQRIADNSAVFNGLVTLAMLAFILPLLDGVQAMILESPRLCLTVLALALILNIGGNLLVSGVAARKTDRPSADAIGLMYGNRNVSFYLAVLPANPLLGLFVALFQVPIYLTPALHALKKRLE